MVTREAIEKILQHIPDPELNVSLWDLGLIYDLTIDAKGNVIVVMTLTSIGCPLFTTMQRDIEEKIGKLKGVKKVTVELTFEPPWSMDRISPKARELLGISI